MEKAKKAHVAQSSTLFMVSASVLSDVSNFDSKSTELDVIEDGITAPLVSVEPEEELRLGVAKAPAGKPIQLKEERVFSQIGERDEQHEHRRWVLDTGETNHMTGARSAFSKLDLEIRGTVKFSDGSVVEIEGRDTILFISKGGEHCKLTGVYFMTRLKANLVSPGQLNRPAASFPSSASYSKSAMIDDGCSRKFGSRQTVLTS